MPVKRLSLIAATFLIAPAWAQQEPLPQPVIEYPRITTRGQLQLQIDDGNRGASSGDDPAAVLNGIGRFRTDDSLTVRRGRVVTTLHLSEVLEISNESNFDTRSQELSVLDLYMRAQLNDNLNLRAGMFKMPFGWEGLRSSRSTNTIEMSDVTRGIYNFRDSGLALGFEDGPWEATVAVMQGQGGVWTDTNAAKDLAARIGYQVDENLRIGASTQLGVFRDDLGQNFPVRRFGLELQFDSDPWKLEAEYMWSDGYNFSARRDTQADGFYVALVHKLNEENDLVLHFDRFEPDLNKVNGIVASNDSNTRNRLVIGWNYYLQRSPEHRFMVNYEFANEEEGPRVPNNGFRVRYQYAW